MKLHQRVGWRRVVESTTAGLDNRRASPPSGRFVIDVDHMQPVVVVLDVYRSKRLALNYLPEHEFRFHKGSRGR